MDTKPSNEVSHSCPLAGPRHEERMALETRFDLLDSRFLVKYSSRILGGIFLILSLNDFFGSSLREHGISFHSLAPIFEKAFFFAFPVFIVITNPLHRGRR